MLCVFISHFILALKLFHLIIYLPVLDPNYIYSLSQNQNLKALVELLAFQNLRTGKLLIILRRCESETSMGASDCVFCWHLIVAACFDVQKDQLCFAPGKKKMFYGM